MDRVERFVKWFQSLGGFIPEDTKQEIKSILEPTYVPESNSFKERPQEIKDTYNHKFKRILDKEDFLSDTPDINKLFFERKDDGKTSSESQ